MGIPWYKVPARAHEIKSHLWVIEECGSTPIRPPLNGDTSYNISGTLDSADILIITSTSNDGNIRRATYRILSSSYSSPCALDERAFRRYLEDVYLEEEGSENSFFQRFFSSSYGERMLLKEEDPCAWWMAEAYRLRQVIVPRYLIWRNLDFIETHGIVPFVELFLDD